MPGITDNAVFLAQSGNMGVVGQEAVAGVNGLGTGQYGGADNLVFIQIAVGGFRAADAVALVRQRHVKGVFVGFGVDRNRGHAHFLAGPYNPDGDFPPVCD